MVILSPGPEHHSANEKNSGYNDPDEPPVTLPSQFSASYALQVQVETPGVPLGGRTPEQPHQFEIPSSFRLIHFAALRHSCPVRL